LFCRWRTDKNKTEKEANVKKIVWIEFKPKVSGSWDWKTNQVTSFPKDSTKIDLRNSLRICI